MFESNLDLSLSYRFAFCRMAFTDGDSMGSSGWNSLLRSDLPDKLSFSQMEAMSPPVWTPLHSEVCISLGKDSVELDDVGTTDSPYLFNRGLSRKLFASISLLQTSYGIKLVVVEQTYFGPSSE